MANTVYEVETVVLQDGKTKIELHPNSIAAQRRFNKRFNEGIEKATSETEETEEGAEEQEITAEDEFEFLLDLVEICLEKRYPKVVADRENMEELFDEPTANRVLFKCGGLQLADPKYQEAVREALMEKVQAGMTSTS